MTTATESQANLVLEYMREHGAITQIDALKKPIKSTRLAARIHDLRSRGIGIKSKPKTYTDTGRKIRYAAYSLEPQTTLGI